MLYQASQAAAIYDVTPQTIHVWAKEFAEYLSISANPGSRKKRQFTTEDMQVFDFISSMQEKNLTFSDIHASLKSGQRGSQPQIEPEEVQAIVSSGIETRLALENERLKSGLIAAQQALTKAQNELANMRQVEDENIKLKAQLESKDQLIEAERSGKREQIEKLETQVQQLTKRIEELSLQTGQEYSRGYREGWTGRGEADEG